MDAAIRSRVEQLGDLELASLLCLVAEQHCIVTANDQNVNDTGLELQHIAGQAFGFSCVLLDCSNGITLDEFREAVLVDVPDESEASSLDQSYEHKRLPGFRHLDARQSVGRHASGYSNTLDERRVANVLIVKHLDQANHHVQVQALELIRTRRLFSHTALHAASKNFLFIALNSTTSTRLPPHLNDLFSISHHHEISVETQRYPTRKWSFDDAASFSSVVRSSSHRPRSITEHLPSISSKDMQHLRECMSTVKTSAEVAAYLTNLTVFMRWNRYVAGGVTANATRHLRIIVRALAVLHGLSFVTPSLAALAVRKTYPHRLIIATAETERSLLWGSDAAAVEENLKGVTVEVAIDDVLASVETPL